MTVYERGKLVCAIVDCVWDLNWLPMSGSAERKDSVAGTAGNWGKDRAL